MMYCISEELSTYMQNVKKKNPVNLAFTSEGEVLSSHF